MVKAAAPRLGLWLVSGPRSSSTGSVTTVGVAIPSQAGPVAASSGAPPAQNTPASTSLLAVPTVSAGGMVKVTSGAPSPDIVPSGMAQLPLVSGRQSAKAQ